MDGWIIGGREVWLLVARPGDDLESLLRTDPDDLLGSRLRVCRGILDGGVVVLGETNPEKDPLLSDLMRPKEEDRP